MIKERRLKGYTSPIWATFSGQIIISRTGVTVSKETGFGMEGRGSIPGRGRNFLSLLHYVRTDSGTHRAFNPVSFRGKTGHLFIQNTHLHLTLRHSVPPHIRLQCVVPRYRCNFTVTATVTSLLPVHKAR